MMIRPMPPAQSTEPSQSRRGCSSLGASATVRAMKTMPAPMSTSPANTKRHEA